MVFGSCGARPYLLWMYQSARGLTVQYSACIRAPKVLGSLIRVFLGGKSKLQTCRSHGRVERSTCISGLSLCEHTDLRPLRRLIRTVLCCSFPNPSGDPLCSFGSYVYHVSKSSTRYQVLQNIQEQVPDIEGEAPTVRKDLPEELEAPPQGLRRISNRPCCTLPSPMLITPAHARSPSLTVIPSNSSDSFHLPRPLLHCLFLFSLPEERGATRPATASSSDRVQTDSQRLRPLVG
jgi:hypothetical protein